MLKFSIWKIKQKTGKRLKKPKIGLKWDFYDTSMILFASKHKKYHLSYTPINQCITNILKSRMILWDFSFKKNSVKFCQAPIYHNWFPRTDIIRHSTGVVTTISLFYNCSQFVTVFFVIYIICNIYVFILRYQHWNKKKQKGTTPHGPFPFQHYVREKN